MPLSEADPDEFARAVEIPYEPDPQGTPTLVYGERPTSLYYDTHDSGFARVTFEGLDALKVCRGEHSPYPNDGLTYHDARYLYLYGNCSACGQAG